MNEREPGGNTGAGYDDVRANYNAVGLAVMERMYSVDYLSIGGTASTDELASLAGIDNASTVLDVGSGLGGPALHLAQTTGCHVTGLDLVELSCEQANERAARRGLSEQAEFRVGDATNMPFAASSFTTVWGQDAWCHVPDKAALIAEVARVLAPGGTVAFTDWVITGDTDQDIREQALVAAASVHMATPAVYRQLLDSHGFVRVVEADISDVFVEQYEAICENLTAMKDELTARFSLRVFETVRSVNHQVLRGFQSGEVGGARFVAHLAD